MTTFVIISTVDVLEEIERESGTGCGGGAESHYSFLVSSLQPVEDKWGVTQSTGGRHKQHPLEDGSLVGGCRWGRGGGVTQCFMIFTQRHAGIL